MTGWRAVGGTTALAHPGTERAHRWEGRLARGGDRMEGQGPAGAAQDGASDAHLLALSSQGDAASFRRLAARHLSPALAVARRLLRDDAEAEDVVQEAMLRLWRQGGGLEIGDAGVRPWLRRVVTNLAIDRMRSGARTDVVEEPPEQSDPPAQLEALEAGERTVRIDRALKRLPERQRQALVLFHYEGLSQAEVGTEMGISDEAVESLLARGRRALKSALAPQWQAQMPGNDDEY